MAEFERYRANLEVADLAPPVEFLRDVLGFAVEVHEPGMGLALLRIPGGHRLAFGQRTAPAS